MSARVAIVVALSVLSGCKKDSPGSTAPPSPSAPASTAELDALWALAPDGVEAGFVASPRALAMVEHAWSDVITFMAAAPELAPAVKELSQELEKKLGFSALSLSVAGLAADKGLAVFGGDQSGVLILPVADRDKFLAVVHGQKGSDFDTLGRKLRCKTTHGVYACSGDVAMLDRLGKGKLRDQLDDAGARGDLEAAGTVEHVSFAVVAQLARGAIVVRGAVKGVPKELADAGWGKTKPHPPDDAAGWATLDVEPLVKKLRGEAPNRPRFAGVSPADVVAAIGGVVHVVVPGGSNVIDARISLRDGKPLATLIEHCEEVPGAPPGVFAYKNGRCRVEVPQLGGLGAEAWVDGDELRVRMSGMPGGNGTASAMSAIGAELARGEWSLAFWGRGTVLAVGDLMKLLPRRAFGMLPSDAMIGIRVMAMINEFGGALAIDGDTARFVATLRTAWSNPDDVVAKIVAIDPRDVLTGKAGDAAKAIADASPDSPFAGDFRAGTGGMMASFAPIGVMSAVAIPTFFNYKKRAKKTEPTLNLDRIGKEAKRAFAMTGAFPAGTAALLPAGGGGLGHNCCGGIGNKCSADPAAFLSDPIWQALEFSIDEPSQYQYEYVSDGRTFTARAYGDLDCDGVSARYELRGSITPAGTVQLDPLVHPPPGVY